MPDPITADELEALVKSQLNGLAAIACSITLSIPKWDFLVACVRECAERAAEQEKIKRKQTIRHCSKCGKELFGWEQDGVNCPAKVAVEREVQR